MESNNSLIDSNYSIMNFNHSLSDTIIKSTQAPKYTYYTYKNDASLYGLIVISSMIFICCCCFCCMDCISRIRCNCDMRRRYRNDNRINRNRVNDNKSYIQYIMSKDTEHKKLEGACCICLETVTKNKSLLECNHLFHKNL